MQERASSSLFLLELGRFAGFDGYSLDEQVVSCHFRLDFFPILVVLDAIGRYQCYVYGLPGSGFFYEAAFLITQVFAVGSRNGILPTIKFHLAQVNYPVVAVKEQVYLRALDAIFL